MLSENGDDKLYGGGGDDKLVGYGGNDTFSGGSGDDECQGDSGDDYIDGGIGHDLLNGNVGDDTIIGSLGGDSIIGGSGDDILYGDLTGSAGMLAGGDDTLEGGVGIDTFVYFIGNKNGTDSILDFEVEEDVLRLADLLGPKSNGVAIGSSLDGDVLIGFGGGGSLELQGVHNPGVTTLTDLAQLITVDFG